MEVVFFVIGDVFRFDLSVFGDMVDIAEIGLFCLEWVLLIAF